MTAGAVPPCRRARTVTGGAICPEALDCRHGSGRRRIKPGEALHRNRCHWPHRSARCRPRPASYCRPCRGSDVLKCGRCSAVSGRARAATLQLWAMFCREQMQQTGVVIRSPRRPLRTAPTARRGVGQVDTSVKVERRFVGRAQERSPRCLRRLYCCLRRLYTDTAREARSNPGADVRTGGKQWKVSSQNWSRISNREK